MWNKRCLCELTGKNSGAVQTCNHHSSRHTLLIIAMATDSVSWHHWNQGGINNKGEQKPNNFWKEEICLNISNEVSTMPCKAKCKGSSEKSTRSMYRNFQWVNQPHCNLTIFPVKLHFCWTSLVSFDIFKKCDMGKSEKKSKAFYDFAPGWHYLPICLTLWRSTALPKGWGKIKRKFELHFYSRRHGLWE